MYCSVAEMAAQLPEVLPCAHLHRFRWRRPNRTEGVFFKRVPPIGASAIKRVRRLKTDARLTKHVCIREPRGGLHSQARLWSYGSGIVGWRLIQTRAPPLIHLDAQTGVRALAVELNEDALAPQARQPTRAVAAQVRARPLGGEQAVLRDHKRRGTRLGHSECADEIRAAYRASDVGTESSTHASDANAKDGISASHIDVRSGMRNRNIHALNDTRTRNGVTARHRSRAQGTHIALR